MTSKLCLSTYQVNQVNQSNQPYQESKNGIQ
jgi:hypothetical protein